MPKKVSYYLEFGLEQNLRANSLTAVDPDTIVIMFNKRCFGTLTEFKEFVATLPTMESYLDPPKDEPKKPANRGRLLDIGEQEDE